MRLILLYIALILLPFVGSSQVGNEWIDFSRTHYSFQIVNTGIYRIDHTTLVNAGIPVNIIAAKEFRIYGKEQELLIHVEDGNDGSIDPGDYIEFYAEGNNAWLDSSLYDDPNHIGNPHYSLYNDTLTYYLTWGGTSFSRMAEETDLNFGAYTVRDWFWKEIWDQKVTLYSQGHKESGLSSSSFTEAEGWYSEIRKANSSLNYFDVPLPTPSVYTGVGTQNAILRTSSVGSSNSNAGNPNHHLRVSFLYSGSHVTKIDTIFSGYKLIKGYTEIGADSLSATTTVRYRFINDLGVMADQQQIGFTSLTYPHQPTANNNSQFKFSVPFNTSEPKSLYNISNFNGTNPLIYILNDSLRRVSWVDNGTIDFLIPNHPSGEDQSIFMIDESQVQSITSLDLVNGTGTFTDFASLGLDSAYLIITHPRLLSSAQQYANFRSSVIGGSHQTLVVNVEELYHQYGGGVPKHAISIKRFAQDILTAWTSQPSNLFLLGKSVREATESTNGTSHGTRKSQTAYAKNLVPSFGYPSSDVMLTGGLTGLSGTPAIPTGRLSAQDTTSVLDYLDKVIDLETAQNDPTYTPANKEWMKRILHFSGGANSQEHTIFQFYLNNYAEIVEDTLFGGNATLFAKTSSAPIDPVDFAAVQDKLEDGVAFMNFFGHASVGGFDQNLDDPENWNNSGKYPIVMGNACYTGDVHQPNAISASEEFVLVPDAGAVAFISNVKTGFSNRLDQYATEFYKQFSAKSYGRSMGYCMQQTADVIGSLANFPFLLETTINQMTLHGDPAVRMYPHGKPELHIDLSSVFFNPSDIDLTIDSVDVNVVITNLGRATNTPFTVEIERILPNNNGDTLYTIPVDGIDYKDTITLRIPVLHNLAMGQNIFNVRVDIPSFVSEIYDESGNNMITKSLFINLDGIVPIYPYDYAIVPNDTITLKGSTVNPFAPQTDYVFQIDTIDFEGAPSPFFREQTVSSVGGIVEASPQDWTLQNGTPAPLTMDDSTVYFWRVSLDSTTPSWIERSFQYIPGRRGWGQSHFYQFKNDEYSVVEYDRPNREFGFGDLSKTISCDLFDNANNAYEWNNTAWYLDGGLQEYGTCGLTPGIYVAVVDPYTLDGWEDNYSGNYPNRDFGNFQWCRSRPEKFFIFYQNNQSHLRSLDTMLTTGVPDGYYLLVWTTIRADYSSWANLHPDLFTTFQNMGATQVDSLNPERCFIFFTRKGNPAESQEVHAQFLGDTIQLVDTVFAANYLGTITTPPAGPASRWSALHWQQHPQEVNSYDSTSLRLVGIMANGTEVPLLDTTISLQDSLVGLDTNYGIDANLYPWLKIRGTVRDSVTFTPAQLDRWQLVYDPVPEAALNPKRGYYFSGLNDTIAEGQTIEMAIAIENITDIDMDSLLVHYFIEDKDHQRNSISYVRQDSLRAHEFALDTVEINTAFFPGFNSLWMDANPYNDTTGIQDQLEQYHFNNVAHFEFFADRDRINPLLDVTFDGLHIMDGEVVSPTPLIVMKLDDENPYMLLNEDTDTASFQVWVTRPDGVQERVYFMNGAGERIMDWYPATGTDNEFVIEYQGDFDLDGVYELLVQANDKSGNESGEFDYRITFEVVNQSTITEVLNYPNPFSTRTQFVFTLTGAELPTYMKIQIMTVSGRVVREITLDELGPLRIGRNMTSYWWDGTDEFGDPLANGVYLYRVTAKINGEDIDYRETNASTYFNKGFGKMYLMR